MERLAKQSSGKAAILRRKLRSYYYLQTNWQAGVVNLINHAAFRAKSDHAGTTSRTGQEMENLLGMDGLAFHQMHRSPRFDSHLFPKPAKRTFFWPGHHPAFFELDQKFQMEGLLRL